MKIALIVAAVAASATCAYGMFDALDGVGDCTSCLQSLMVCVVVWYLPVSSNAAS